MNVYKPNAMKRLLLLPAFLIISALSTAQRLSIVGLSGLPTLPADTAYDSISYPVSISIANTGGGVYTGGVDVLMQAGQNPVHTLYSDTSRIVQLTQGMVDTLFNPSYIFDAVNFDSGDNIVVVWPAARVAGTPSDTVSILIHFQQLPQGVESPVLKPISVFPNPSSSFIYLKPAQGEILERVRILSLSGALFLDDASGAGLYRVDALPAGVYVLTAVMRDGSVRVARVMVESGK